MPIDITQADTFRAVPLNGVIPGDPKIIDLQVTHADNTQETVLSWLQTEIQASTSPKGLTRILARAKSPVVTLPKGNSCCCSPSSPLSEAITSVKDAISAHVVVTIPRSASENAKLRGVNHLVLSAVIQTCSALLAECFRDTLPVFTLDRVDAIKDAAVSAGFLPREDSAQSWSSIRSLRELETYLGTYYSDVPAAVKLGSAIHSYIDAVTAASGNPGAAISNNGEGEIVIAGTDSVAHDSILSQLALGINLEEPLKALAIRGGSFVLPNPAMSDAFENEVIAVLAALPPETPDGGGED